jgi:uncharacterized cupin superfamily protein
MRLLKIEPGGHIGLHSHKNRPAVVYFLQGTDTVMQADGSSKTFHPGDMSSATKDTTHWHRNDGKDDVLLIAVDVFQPQSCEQMTLFRQRPPPEGTVFLEPLTCDPAAVVRATSRTRTVPSRTT